MSTQAESSFMFCMHVCSIYTSNTVLVHAQVIIFFFFLIFLPNTILKNPHRVTLCTCSSLHLEYRARDGLAGPNTGILSFSKFWQIVWQCGGSGLIPHSGP